MLLICLLVFLASLCSISHSLWNTKDEDFGICSSSFLKLPSMDIYFFAQRRRPICISQNPHSYPKCSDISRYKNNQACIAVLFLEDWGIPLFSAFHIRKSGTNRITEGGTRPNRGQCESVNRHKYKSNWNKNALDNQGDTFQWNRGNWYAEGKYNRGHLVPVCLASIIGPNMGAATFNMFNVAPQDKFRNSDIGRYEQWLDIFATHYCLSNKILGRDVLKDFYFLTGTMPDYISRKYREPGSVQPGDTVNWIGPDNDDDDEVLHDVMKQNYGPLFDRRYSNIPGLFWTAACCRYILPGRETFAVTASYYAENFKETKSFVKTLTELKEKISWYSRTYGSHMTVHSFFGSTTACEKEYRYQEIEDILKRYTGKNDVLYLMNQLNPLFLTSFPKP